MNAWLRLTWLFGLPDHEQPEDLMAAALGPILRASQNSLAEAPLPARMLELLQQLADQECSALTAELIVPEAHVLAAETRREAALGELTASLHP